LERTAEHVDDAIDALQVTFHTQESRRVKQPTMGAKHIGANGDVARPCFVLQRQKQHSFGRSWSLSDDDVASDANVPSVRHASDFGACDRAPRT
jgi:hypothetical protein